MKQKLALKLSFLLLAFAVFAGAVVWDYTRAPTRQLEKNIQTAATEQGASGRKTLPHFSFKDLNGKSYNISDYTHGEKQIFINFWASWCAPCIEEFPIMIEQARKYPQDWIILAFSVDENPAEARKFIQRFAADWPQNMILAADHDKAISQGIFQTIRYPESYILSPHMTIRRKIVGMVSPADFE